MTATARRKVPAGTRKKKKAPAAAKGKAPAPAAEVVAPPVEAEAPPPPLPEGKGAPKKDAKKPGKKAAAGKAAPQKGAKDAGKKAAPGKKAPGKKAAGKKAPRKGKGGTPAVARAAGRRTAALAREMLCMELRRVRSLFREIAERYRDRTEGILEAIVADVEVRRFPAPLVEKMLAEVRSLSVKEKKGRRKDLVRIERLAASLGGKISP